MEGKKTTARRASRTATTRPAPVPAAKQPARPKVVGPKTAKPKVRPKVAAAAAPAIEERQRMVEMAAYFRAERRGFEPGLELEDWFAAEAEIESQFAPAAKKKPSRRPRKTPAA